MRLCKDEVECGYVTLVIALRKQVVGLKGGNGINLCSVYPANNPYYYTHYYLKLPDVYVGIVGWIYRTKIDPISILQTYPCFLTFLSNGHPYIFFISQKCFFPYIYIIYIYI